MNTLERTLPAKRSTRDALENMVQLSSEHRQRVVAMPGEYLARSAVAGGDTALAGFVDVDADGYVHASLYLHLPDFHHVVGPEDVEASPEVR